MYQPSGNQTNKQGSGRSFAALGFVFLGFVGQASAYGSTLTDLKAKLSFQQVDFADSKSDNYFLRGSYSDIELEYLAALPEPELSTGGPVLGLIPTGANNEPWTKAVYEMFGVDYHTACLRVTDSGNKERYQIPESVWPKRGADETKKPEIFGLEATTDPFSFTFKDQRYNDGSHFYVKSTDTKAVFNDKFIRYDFKLPSQRVFGFGERISQFMLEEGVYEMWNYGLGNVYDPATAGNQAYGTHPFVMWQSKDKNEFAGMYFHNSNAQAPILSFDSDGEESTLTYITTGGILEVYFFLHGSPQFILQRYHNFIGRPHLPPFWSMGFHQSSWTYETQPKLQAMIDGYDAAKIPLEAVWLDIPYMDKYADFTVDTTAFPTLKALTTALHAKKRHIIPIIDAGLSADGEKNPTYVKAKAGNLLVKSTLASSQAKFGGNLALSVWPVHAVFPDYFQKAAQTLWIDGITELRAEFDFDGIWLDMNEATGFCDGECPDATKAGPTTLLQASEDTPVNAAVPPCVVPAGDNMKWYCSYADQSAVSTFMLPFVPGQQHNGYSLDTMAMSTNATHVDDDQKMYTEYNVHNLYGYMESKTTFEYFAQKTIDQRPFTLSRSTFAGSGKYVSHWTGDNDRSYDFMKYSVAGIMNMNMFGIPHTGADVCGFQGTQDDQMCGRWTQLSTFYPFARNHYTKQAGTTPSEPYLLKTPYKEMATSAIFQRLTVARFMYTQLAKIHRFGGSMFSPLFYYYPTDDSLYGGIESSFIVGDALMILPVLEKDAEDVTVFFPQGVWVNFWDRTDVIDTSDKGIIKKVPTSNDNVLTYQREGTIVPWQPNADKKMTQMTEFLIDAQISLVVNLDSNGQASGELLVDDGMKQSSLDNQAWNYHKFSITSNNLHVWHDQLNLDKNFVTANRNLEEIIIVNQQTTPGAGMFACAINQNTKGTPTTTAMHAIYNKVDKSVRITPTTKIQFQDINQISFGIKGVDINFCEPKFFEYSVQSAVDLSAATASFIITHNENVLPDLIVHVERFEHNVVNLQINYEIQPDGVKTPYDPDLGLTPGKLADASVGDFVRVTNSPFSLQIGALPQVVFDTKDMQLGFSEYMTRFGIEMNYDASTPGLWGMGDHYSNDLFLPDGIYGQWNRDAGNPFLDQTLPTQNTYGTHPFFVFKTHTTYDLPEQAYYGVFMKNVNAADFELKTTKSTGKITFQATTTGGLINYFFMPAETAHGVVKKYHSLVGNPTIVPQWALGWNQCRWGWITEAAEKEVHTKYTENKIPLDVMWSDIDYMENYRDFTVDPKNYPTQGKYVDDLHTAGIQYVPIIDAGVALRPAETYAFYNTAEKAGVFIQDYTNKEDFIGRVWPNDAVFLDWFNDKAAATWQAGIDMLLKDVNFDGLWLDMNEASNFCDGVCYQNQMSPTPSKYNLPYVPTGRDLEFKSISLDAVHEGGLTELDVHSTYGFYEVKATSEWFTKNKKRPMIISRSSAAGQGKYGSRWLGDNYSDMAYLSISVPGIINSNMYGMPLSGVDICGFGGNTTPELCARWTVVGALYPFSRNHNAFDSKDQYPYTFLKDIYKDKVSYGQIMIDGIRNKYRVVRYMYSELIKLSKTGGQLYKPVFYNYGEDFLTWADNQNTWMIGDALKVSANTNVLGKDTTDVYFPNGFWCDIFTDTCFSTSGKVVTLKTEPQDIYAHLAYGHLISYSHVDDTVNSIADLNKNVPVSFKANPLLLDQEEQRWTVNNTAVLYYNDDGVSFETEGKNNTYYVEIGNTKTQEASRVTINFEMVHQYTEMKSKTLEGCYAINKADYLGDIHVYNAQGTGLYAITHESYYTFADGTKDGPFQNVSVDQTTGVLTVAARTDKDLCLGNLVMITLIQPL